MLDHPGEGADLVGRLGLQLDRGVALAQRLHGVERAGERLGDQARHVERQRRAHRQREDGEDGDQHERRLLVCIGPREDLVFGENLTNRVVELFGGLQVPADRLLDNDAGLFRNQTMVADMGRDVAEYRGTHGEVEGAHPVFALGQKRLERIPAACRSGIDGNIVQP